MTNESKNENKKDTTLGALDSLESEEDMLQIFIKPVTEMTDEELEYVYKKIQAKRKKKIKRGREKTELDLMLEKLTPEMAQQIVKRLEIDKIEKKEEVEEKEEEEEENE